MRKIIYGIILIAIIGACKTSYFASDGKSFATYTDTLDTSTRLIEFQVKQVFHPSEDIYASNQFDGARLNNFQAINDSVFQADCFPENQPINPSPWYAFKIWSTQPRQIQVNFNFGDFSSRYIPKVSLDGSHWTTIDSNMMDTTNSNLSILLNVSPDTLWISAQELFTEKDLVHWMVSLSQESKKWVNFGIAGKSTLSRNFYYMHIGKKTAEHKDLIVLLSRQHPPEVTGEFALQAFIRGLLDTNKLQRKFFRKYDVLVFPMMNPDGVALGHWRHNAGGIDLNRDWAVYHQQETKLVTDFIKNYQKTKKDQVVLGLDFHSTWYDIYYTNLTDSSSVLPNFTKEWIASIKQGLEHYDPRVAASNMRQPVSKNWFYVNYKAVGITYEIGDDTDRDFIEKKGILSAKELIRILVDGKSR